MEWMQVYDPLGNFSLSAAAAALPLVVLLTLIAVVRVKAYVAGIATMLLTVVEALIVWRMPWDKVASSLLLGGAFALFPIGYIVLGSLCLYNLVVETGLFASIRASLEGLSRDRRIQALLVAFCFTAFLDSTTGFLTPLTICTSILRGLGFEPHEAARLGLLAGSMPSAFGAMGISIVVLSQVSGLPAWPIAVMSGRQMALLALMMPFILVAGMKRDERSVDFPWWPYALATGGAYAVTLFSFSNFISYSSAALVSALASLIAMVGLLRWKQPSSKFTTPLTPVGFLKAWSPFAILTLVVLLWSAPPVQALLNRATLAVPATPLHRRVMKVPPASLAVVPMDAVLNLNWASTAGTAIMVSAIISAVILKVRPGIFGKVAVGTARQIRFSVLTMISLFGAAYLMNYSGMSTTLALALARSGRLFPLVSPLLGWIGAMIVGSNTAADAMLGSLQAITAARVGIPPVLALAANGTAAVFGKVVSPQFLTVAATVAGMPGEESSLFRRVFFTCFCLAIAVGVISLIQAYLFPWMIPAH